jgi:hypothetical protein
MIDLTAKPETPILVSQREPTGDEATFPVILYSLDSGWSFRDAHTHGHCVRPLDVGSHTPNLSPYGAP